MSTSTLVSVEEYLATTWRPDCDYVDGEVLERNLGQNDHSDLQSAALVWFRERRRALSLNAFVEQRVRIGQRRFRIPDVVVVRLPWEKEQVFTRPPYICIEALSPDDTLSRLQQRVDDYLAMGVENVWVIDPESRRAWRITPEGHLEARDGVLRTTDGHVAMPVADLFVP